MSAATKSAIAAEVTRIATIHPHWAERAWVDGAITNIHYNLQFNPAAVKFAHTVAHRLAVKAMARPV